MQAFKTPPKRPPPEGDPPPSPRRVQYQSFSPGPRSSAHSNMSLPDSTLVGVPPIDLKDRMLAGPANPGFIRDRSQGVLSRLPKGSDAFETFAKLRSDDNLTDEEAFLKLITTYDVPLSTLNRISCEYLTSFHCRRVWLLVRN